MRYNSVTLKERWTHIEGEYRAKDNCYEELKKWNDKGYLYIDVSNDILDRYWECSLENLLKCKPDESLTIRYENKLEKEETYLLVKRDNKEFFAKLIEGKLNGDFDLKDMDIVITDSCIFAFNGYYEG